MPLNGQCDMHRVSTGTLGQGKVQHELSRQRDNAVVWFKQCNAG